MKLIFRLFSFCLFINFSTGYASPQSAIWYSVADDKQVTLDVDLFLTSTCPHCQQADAFFHDLVNQEPWLKIHRYYINKDKSSLQAFYEHLQQQHSTNFSVPAIFFCDSRWAGFDKQVTSGKVLLQAMQYCRDKISQQGQLSQVTINLMRQWGNASQFQLNPEMIRSARMIIPLTALTEALLPCSLFCFAAFLAFMWLYPSSKWVQFSVGLVFLLSLGVIHYIQQVQHASNFQLIPYLRVAAVLVGFLLLFFSWKDNRKMTSGVVMTPTILVYVTIIFTVIALQTYQQLCKFNVALIFEQWLTEQTFSPARQLFFQAIYQVVYLLPLSLILLLFLIFGRQQRATSYQDMLKISAKLILVSIGILLVVYPSLIANLSISIVVLLVSIGVGLYFRYKKS